MLRSAWLEIASRTWKKIENKLQNTFVGKSLNIIPFIHFKTVPTFTDNGMNPDKVKLCELTTSVERAGYLKTSQTSTIDLTENARRPTCTNKSK